MTLEVDGGTQLATDVRAHIIGQEGEVSPIAWISPKRLTRIPHQGGVALKFQLQNYNLEGDNNQPYKHINKQTNTQTD